MIKKGIPGIRETEFTRGPCIVKLCYGYNMNGKRRRLSK